MPYLEELREKIKDHKQSLHYKLLADNKSLFQLLDILIILMILMNFGAVFLTGMSVAQKENLNLYEVNPIQAKLNNYELHPKAKVLFTNFIINMFLWIGFFLTYFYFRRTIYDEFHLLIFMTTVVASFFFIGLDFFNNTGFWIGMLIK